MKHFIVDVDFTVTKRLYVEAENAEQASQMVKDKCKVNPSQYYTQADACLEACITEVNEDCYEV